MNKRLEQLETELRLRGFSDRTISNYLHYNQEFLEFSKKEPDTIEENDIKQFMSKMIATKMKPATVNLARCSLKFFYSEVLQKNIFGRIRTVKLEKKLPTVLSRDEVQSVLKAVKNRRDKLMIELMYSAGLRVSEAVNIKVEDLDFKEKIGTVRGGKGKKDRLIILSERFITQLEPFIRENQVKGILFPISRRYCQKVVSKAAKDAGISRRVFCHALRSSFATHLLDSGTDIRVIQELLGHANLSTTERYTKVSREQIKKVKSPLDSL